MANEGSKKNIIRMTSVIMINISDWKFFFENDIVDSQEILSNSSGRMFCWNSQCLMKYQESDTNPIEIIVVTIT
ncbi:hypothetical protein DERP_002975 [Dermatophagoides pteronyssinus]|uniref:Uncharacterized protein n=1 Tax=Dermatophagoides pteronyssinus TaxID=6956 RepID=A0ABQ8JW75_DERPT|nr:hypothetical protein DERP_002975 [Dermatophagoides pteronyssinus]